MQQHEQIKDVPANGDDRDATDILHRQKRFALVLSGDEQVAQALLTRLAQVEDSAAGKSLSPSARQFFAFKKLYELWLGEARRASMQAPLFQPGHEHEAVRQGLDPSIARVMGGLPSLHRALLLLVYGENFSYAATAQLFNITVEELMGALAAARQKFSVPEGATAPSKVSPATAPKGEVSHDATL